MPWRPCRTCPTDVVMVYAGGPVAGRSFVHDLALAKARGAGPGRPLPHHGLPLRGGPGDVDRGHAPGHPALHRPVGLGLDVLLDRGRQAHAGERPAQRPRVRAAARRAPCTSSARPSRCRWPPPSATCWRGRSRTPTRPCSGWPRSSAWSGRWSATWPWPGRQWPSVGPEGQPRRDEHHPGDRGSPGSAAGPS